MRTTSLLIALVLLGCQGYKTGSFVGPRGYFEGEQRTVGCLDVAVFPATDSESYGPVAGLTIANRCDVGVVVDIGAIRATGRFLDGTGTLLRAYDPAWEIRPATLEARSVAKEYIEYLPAQQDEPLFSEWCLDLSRLDPARPTDRPVLVCFANGVRA